MYKIEIEARALSFLIDLGTFDGLVYKQVCNKIRAIAKNPELRESELNHFDFAIKVTKSKSHKNKKIEETLIFTQYRTVNVGHIHIVYSWAEKEPRLIYVTAIYDSSNPNDTVSKYFGK